MTALWMRELAPTEVPGFDDSNRDQLLCRNASTHDRVSKFGRDSASQRRLRVLVVDDEQDSAESLIRMLHRWGHAAHVAFDGLAALRVAATRNPDVVLLNMEMPLLDGCQVARQLRLDFSSNECFIIAFAERADDEHRQQCIEAGVDVLLIKPVDPSVVEILLLLECELVNRSQTDNAACLAAKGTSQFLRKRLSADERDRAAKISGSRQVAGTASGQQP